LRKDFYDPLETRHPDVREDELLGRLPNLVALALSAAGWSKHLNGIDPNSIISRDELAQLPVLRNADIPALQALDPPFGGLGNMSGGKLRRVLMSPGPIYHPQASGRDWGGAARAMFAAGIRSRDVVLNCFSYHLVPEGFIMESGAHALGCTVIAAGHDNAIHARDVMASLRPTAYLGTAGFLKRLLDAAGRGNSSVSFKHALIAGLPLSRDLRNEFRAAGIAIQECILHPDIGVIAYESDACDGMIVNEGLIVEIVRPGTGEPVAAGETGELVVTALNPDYPMIRFATGHLSAILRGRSPCARTNVRIKGILGRV
jgi:phenylacetate-CoA ligase